MWILKQTDPPINHFSCISRSKWIGDQKMQRKPQRWQGHWHREAFLTCPCHGTDGGLRGGLFKHRWKWWLSSSIILVVNYFCCGSLLLWIITITIIVDLDKERWNMWPDLKKIKRMLHLLPNPCAKAPQLETNTLRTCPALHHLHPTRWCPIDMNPTTGVHGGFIHS